MSDLTRLSVERDPELDGLLTITLDRPDKLNALDVALHDELQALLAQLETDHSVPVVILTGAGPGIHFIQEDSPDEIGGALRRWYGGI